MLTLPRKRNNSALGVRDVPRFRTRSILSVYAVTIVLRTEASRRDC